MHFPRLRILWCQSPYATAELFEELKVNIEILYSWPGYLTVHDSSGTPGQDTSLCMTPQGPLARIPHCA